MTSLTPGTQYGALTIVGPKTSYLVNGRTRYQYACRCACGSYHTIRADQWGRIQSCGCEQRAASKARATTHGESLSPLHQLWVNLRTRGTHPEWDDYLAFKAWASPVPDLDAYELTRIDPTQPYGPTNAAWTPRRDRRGIIRRRTNTVLVHAFGTTKPLMAWVEETADPTITYALVYQRIFKHGWDAERALTTTKGTPFHA